MGMTKEFWREQPDLTRKFFLANQQDGPESSESGLGGCLNPLILDTEIAVRVTISRESFAAIC
jgi:hypothetical protein